MTAVVMFPLRRCGYCWYWSAGCQTPCLHTPRVCQLWGTPVKPTDPRSWPRAAPLQCSGLAAACEGIKLRCPTRKPGLLLQLLVLLSSELVLLLLLLLQQVGCVLVHKLQNHKPAGILTHMFSR